MADWFDGAGSGGAVDAVALLDGKAATLVAEAVQLGALVSLSTTRDGGALGVTVTVDGRYRREYFRDAEELAAWMHDAVAATEAALSGGRPAGASRVPRKRSSAP